MAETLQHPQLALPWGATADGDLTRTAATMGAVLGTLAVFTVFPLAIIGIVLNCMGLDRVTSAPDTARTLMLVSWVTLAAAPALVLFLTLALLLVS